MRRGCASQDNSGVFDKAIMNAENVARPVPPPAPPWPIHQIWYNKVAKILHVLLALRCVINSRTMPGGEDALDIGKFSLMKSNLIILRLLQDITNSTFKTQTTQKVRLDSNS
jgi:hypothetical protein